MGDLSKHFDRSEFACPCCGKLPDPIPPRLIRALEALRSLVGCPIHITSAWRCAEKNKAVGGARNSYHKSGEAADITFGGISPKAMYHLALYIKAFRDGGLGIYPKYQDDQGKTRGNFIHVDVRRGAARWAKIGPQKVNFYDHSS